MKPLILRSSSYFMCFSSTHNFKDITFRRLCFILVGHRETGKVEGKERRICSTGLELESNPCHCDKD